MDMCDRYEDLISFIAAATEAEADADSAVLVMRRATTSLVLIHVLILFV